MRRVPDQCQALLRDAGGVMEAERIAGAVPDFLDRPEDAVHLARGFGLERALRQGHDAVAVALRHGPYQRAAVAALIVVAQRQQGERSGGVEDFPRDTVMRFLVRQPGDDCAVAVVPLGEGHACVFARGRHAAFRADHQAGFEDRAVGQRGGDAVFAALALHDLGPGVPGDVRLVLCRFKQGEAQLPVGEHAAQRSLMRFGREIDAARFHAVGHGDGGDLAAVLLQRVGDADVREQVPACG